jgi:hypothetical protein
MTLLELIGIGNDIEDNGGIMNVLTKGITGQTGMTPSRKIDHHEIRMWWVPRVFRNTFLTGTWG